MAADGRTMHGGTYNSNPLVCAAVIAACRETGAEGFYERLNARGARLAEGLVAAAEAAGLEACWSGVGAHVPAVVLAGAADATTARPTRSSPASPFFALYRELRDRGMLIQPPQEGLFLTSGRPHRRRHRPHARGGGRRDAGRSSGARRGDRSDRWEDSDETCHRIPGARRRDRNADAGCGSGTSAGSSGDTGSPVNGGILSAGHPRQPRPPRPRPVLHQRGLGDPRGHQQRPAHVQEGGRRRRSDSRTRYRQRDAHGHRRRQDLHLPRAPRT